MTFLLAQTGITALVGDRIHFVQAPQDVAPPYLVFQKISDPPQHSHDGPLGLSNPRFQFSAFAETYSAAKQVVAAVQAVLDGYKGIMGDLYIGGAFRDDENDLERGTDGLFGVAADYIIWHREE